MGFRDNKVTRRVALGTIAAGMAGSAFVIKALKAKYQTPIPASPRYEEKFVTAWADSLKQIAIPSQKIAGPSSFSVKLNVPEGKAYDVFVLDCSFTEGENVETLDPTVFPLVFTRGHGIIKAKRLAGKDSLVLSAKADLFEALARNCDPAKGLDTSTGEYVFVPKGDRIGDVILSDGSTRSFPGGNLPLCCTYLASALWYYFPGEAHLKAGANWQIPPGIDSEFALPCEVVGFERMAGRDTAVISCRREQQEFRTSNNCVYVSVAKVSRTHKEVLKTTSKEFKSRNSFHLTAHLDLETGLPVRQELRSRGELQMPNSHVHSVMGFHLSRILDA
jgi:hypothetical protein